MVNKETLLEQCEGKIKVLALTGIRSEYDLMFPLLTQLENSPQFDLGIIVSGAHLTPLHNYSVQHIEQDNFKIVDRIENYLNSSSTSAKVHSIGSLIQGLSITLNREKPDLIMMLGDREEVIAASIAGSYMRIPVVHLAAGDATWTEGGDVDEEIRFAASKLSHVFFTMTEAHTVRMNKLGEEPWRSFTVGSGGLDRIREVQDIDKEQLAASISPLISEPFVVCIYHALSSYTKEQVESELTHCIESALNNNLNVFLGAPNSDPGYEWVLGIYKRYENHPKIHQYNHLARNEFINMLRHANALIGNSSLGVHEAGFIGLPAVNVGERQSGRLMDNNITFVENDAELINSTLKKAAFDENFRQKITKNSSIYGDGYMAEKAIKALLSLPSKETLLAKKITY